MDEFDESDVRELWRVIDESTERRKRLLKIFMEELKLLIDLVYGPEMATAYRDMTPDQRELVMLALETGAKAGLQDSPNDFVFIAHATPDVLVAERIGAALTGKRVQCFLAKRDLGIGDWNQKIVEALEQCTAMIVLLSDAATTSDYVKSEVQTAFERKVPIVPINVTSQPVRKERIDNRLRTLQEHAWIGNEDAMLKLLLDHFRAET
jgi:hypothetical protein